MFARSHLLSSEYSKTPVICWLRKCLNKVAKTLNLRL